ncbi:MAG: hypothetical protein HY096_01615 [Nitrospinae bacterium]|nr:hypothetical protein [Nitrospinota bacterium]
MTEKKEGITKTLGQAIDEIIQALQSLDQNSRITAINAVCEHLSIPLIEKSKSEPQSETLQHSAKIMATPLQEIKNFREQKRPSSANEMASLIAFYLSEMAQDRKAEVEVDDMVKYFKEAEFPLPKAPQVLLQNAKNAGYFDSVGGGKYKLNPVGYNLVAHNLPRTQSELSPTGKRTRRKQTKKTSSKNKGNRK